MEVPAIEVDTVADDDGDGDRDVDVDDSQRDQLDPDSPPTTLQQLHLDEPQRQPQPEPIPLANTIVSDVDESDDPLCSIEKMLEDTCPTYNNNIKTDIDANQSIITPAKRVYNEVTVDNRTFIEILSSDSDSSPTKNDGAVLTNPPRLTYPIAKQYHLQTQPNHPTHHNPAQPHVKNKNKNKNANAPTSLPTPPPQPPPQPSPPHPHSPPPPPPSTSTSNRPPSKRTKKKHKSSTTAFQKHTKHWELDGNTLVQIKHVRFKLQRSRLARHGEWFRHTFEQADAAPELYEDEVLHLDRLGIIVRDFSTLLDALDDAITYLHNPPSFHTLSSILRASTILSFTAFQEWAIQELETMWSPRLADLSTDRIPHATESLALADFCGLTRVKKRAMYELVRLPGYGQIQVNNVNEDEDGGMQQGGDADDEEDEGGRKSRVKLADEHKDALTRGREQLMSLWIMTATQVAKDFVHCPSLVGASTSGGGSGSNNNNAEPSASSTSSSSSKPCTTTTPELLHLAHMRLVHESGIMEEYAFDVVCGLQALVDAPWAEAGFCEGCVQIRRRAWQLARVKAWENLGIWFEIF